nr:hypothetical protein OH837_41665 [Streptomyces canus]
MGIPLAQALAELRRELHQAQDEGAAEQFRFEVEQAELSLDVEFRSDGKGLTLQVRYEALGGQGARIRRVTGGLGNDDTPHTGRPDRDDSDHHDPSGDVVSGHEDAVADSKPWE